MLLITGVTGHTGGYFLQQLIDNNYTGEIRCIVRQSSDTYALDQCGLKIEKVIGDLNNPQVLEEAITRVDTVVHIYNIHHSPMIIRAAINNQVKRVVLVHTTGIYSKFKKASQEYKEVEKEVLRLSQSIGGKINVTILRPTMIYGDLCDRNISKFIRMVDKLKVIPVINKGENLIQPVHAKDLATAIYEVLVSPEKTKNKAYIISGDRPIKMIEVLKAISKGLNKKTLYMNIPIRFAILVAICTKIASIGKIDIVEKIQRMGEDRSYSHEAAKIDLGYSPIPFETGLQTEIEAYRCKINS